MASEVKTMGDLPGLQVYPKSEAEVEGARLFLARTPEGERRLGVIAFGGPAGRLPVGFEGEATEHGDERLLICPPSHANAVALRRALPWLAPQKLGLRTSAGYGDRLGVATPGHVRAARWAVAHRGDRETPGSIFAQQSIREMARTVRSPEDVLDDATWGVFQEGWTAADGALGADADHLKTPADADRCSAVGYSFYTIDPGEHVDPGAGEYDEPTARVRFAALPWPGLDSAPADLLGLYAGHRFDLEDRAITLNEETVMRAAIKYGRAVAHTAMMYRHLCDTLGEDNFELEVSVDETDTPTTHAEHLFIASELQRLGVRWVSLAPRYVGRFEKGVDYIPPEGTAPGDMRPFEADFAGHAAIARAFGPYKLSLHSGSDKYSVYGIAARLTRGLVHLKTAGTSYLAALDCAARTDPALFREIAEFAVTRYETDRATYHVSASLRNVPDIATVPDSALPGLLVQFDAREVLHVTFGSVLNAPEGFKARLMSNLAQNEETYYEILEKHFIRHVEPLMI